MSTADDSHAQWQADLVEAIVRLPKCPRCSSPAIDGYEEHTVSTLEKRKETHREFLQCVSCLHQWEDVVALGVVRDVRREYRQLTFGRDIATRVLAEHKRARAVYEEAGAPLPKWLLKARPEWHGELIRERGGTQW